MTCQCKNPTSFPFPEIRKIWKDETRKRGEGEGESHSLRSTGKIRTWPSANPQFMTCDCKISSRFLFRKFVKLEKTKQGKRGEGESHSRRSGPFRCGSCCVVVALQSCFLSMPIAVECRGPTFAVKDYWLVRARRFFLVLQVTSWWWWWYWWWWLMVLIMMMPISDVFFSRTYLIRVYIRLKTIPYRLDFLIACHPPWVRRYSSFFGSTNRCFSRRFLKITERF